MSLTLLMGINGSISNSCLSWCVAQGSYRGLVIGVERSGFLSLVQKMHRGPGLFLPSAMSPDGASHKMKVSNGISVGE